MKQKYTIHVADSEIHIITEEPKEALDTIVGVVDRRVREIHLHSPHCSRVDAAIILCMEYCAEKLKLKNKIKQANAEIERLNVMNEASERERAALEREIEALRASLNLSTTSKHTQKTTALQLGFDDIDANNEPLEVILDHSQNDGETQVEETPVITESAVDKILNDEDDSASEEAVVQDGETEDDDKKTHAKANRKKVRSIFDLNSFDDI